MANTSRKSPKTAKYFSYPFKNRKIKAVKLDTVDMGFLLDMADAEKEGELSILKFAYERIILPESQELARSMKPKDLGKFMEAWNNSTPASLGE